MRTKINVTAVPYISKSGKPSGVIAYGIGENFISILFRNNIIIQIGGISQILTDAQILDKVQFFQNPPSL